MSDPRPIEVTTLPGLEELVEDIRAEATPRILRRKGEDLAIIVPLTGDRVSRARRPRTETDYLLFLSSAGSWRDIVDADRFREENDASRRRSSRPPVEL